MLGIILNRDSELQLWRQIYQAIKEKMMCGHLKAAEALPSTRELANELGVSRNTVCMAYEMLVAEGYAVSHQGAPTRVMDGLYLEPFIVPQSSNQFVERIISADFRTGKPDLRQFPRFLWQQLMNNTTAQLPLTMLDYSTPQGLFSLRQEIAAWLFRSRGMTIDPNDVFISAGATHALHLIAGLLCGKEAKIILEDPCHTGMLRSLTHRGTGIVPIPVDSEGIRVDEFPVDANIRAVYVTPSHQFPMGGILSASRRAALVRYARENNVYIIEDDYDSEFRYSGELIAPLHAIDPQRVIYVGTFSKSLFPALRIGYVILPYGLQQSWRVLRTHMDVQNPPFEQAALAELLRTRKFDRHVHKMRRIYRQRREVLLEALRQLLGERCCAHGDSAGLHVAIEYPGLNFNEEFQKRCFESGILVTGMQTHCIRTDWHHNKLLLGYGHLNSEEIKAGVNHLARIMKEFENQP